MAKPKKKIEAPFENDIEFDETEEIIPELEEPDFSVIADLDEPLEEVLSVVGLDPEEDLDVIATLRDNDDPEAMHPVTADALQSIDASEDDENADLAEDENEEGLPIIQKPIVRICDFCKEEVVVTDKKCPICGNPLSTSEEDRDGNVELDSLVDDYYENDADVDYAQKGSGYQIDPDADILDILPSFQDDKY